MKETTFLSMAVTEPLSRPLNCTMTTAFLRRNTPITIRIVVRIAAVVITLCLNIILTASTVGAIRSGRAYRDFSVSWLIAHTIPCEVNATSAISVTASTGVLHRQSIRPLLLALAASRRTIAAPRLARASRCTKWTAARGLREVGANWSTILVLSDDVIFHTTLAQTTFQVSAVERSCVEHGLGRTRLVGNRCQWTLVLHAAL
jgi:hypothetical protein